MNTSTVVVEEEWSDEKVSGLILKFWVYAVEGLILMATNFTILAAIMKQKILRTRKEYIIVGGLSMTDGISGLATFLAGVGRNWLLMVGTGTELVSRWSCLLMPWNLIYVWIDPLVSVMLLVISVDRLLAVSLPYSYFKFGIRYGYLMVGSVYIWIWISSLFAATISYTYQEPEYPAVCFTAMALDSSYYVDYHSRIRIAGAFGSVLVYIAVVLVTMVRGKPTKVNPDRQTRSAAEIAYWRRQARLTTTLGQSCLFTLFLFVLPRCIELYSSSSDRSAAQLAFIVPYSFIVNNLNPMANYFLYTLRHRDIRLGVSCLFSGKELTAVMLKEGSRKAPVTGQGRSAGDLNDVLYLEDYTVAQLPTTNGQETAMTASVRRPSRLPETKQFVAEQKK